jgi:hypothetical protein
MELGGHLVKMSDDMRIKDSISGGNQMEEEKQEDQK